MSRQLPGAAVTTPPGVAKGGGLGPALPLPATPGPAGRAAPPVASPHFQRTPRHYPTLPTGAYQLQAPPPAPQPPATSLVVMVLPIVGTAAGIAIVLRLGQGQFLLLSLPIMVCSYLAAIYSYGHDRWRYRRERRARDWTYGQYLERQEAAFASLVAAERAALLTAHPDLPACQQRAERRDPERRLWERSPRDDDFLHLRLGLGAARPGFTIAAPDTAQLEVDPLAERAAALATRFAAVPDAPILLPLADAGIVALVGDRRAARGMARALLMQLATHHAAGEVRIALSFQEVDRAAWEWARWLPHCWDAERSARAIADSPEGTRALLTQLHDILRQRRGRAGTGDAWTMPAYVCIFAAPQHLTGPAAASIALALQSLLIEGPALGVYTLFLEEREEAVRAECRAVVAIEPGIGRLRLVGPPPREVPFRPDVAAPDHAERLARTLAPLRVQSLATAAALPESLPFLALLGVRRVEELAVHERWRASAPYRTLAAPLGMRGGGGTVYLDLHERGHGPHGLVAGTTGSGKSELLQSLIASLAVHYHPHELTFVLIDYKGGGMASAFRDLPHQIGIITNLEGALALRALIALRSEMQRRQRLFDRHLADRRKHIDDYQQLQRERGGLEPLARLVIIADEFAELKQTQPEFIDELISIVRIGRSLGVHLILATQKPAGVVSDQIWSNTSFRIALKVATTEDSREVLKRAEAAEIARPGRAYLQVGNNEIFELFQAGFSGAPYAPDEGRAGEGTIAAVHLDGHRTVLWEAAPAARPAPAPQKNQLQAIVEHLAAAARAAGIARLPGPWLPPLAETIALDALPPFAGQPWDPAAWARRPAVWLAPVVGLLDDPARQEQRPLALPLGRDGHAVIFGAPGTGKSTLLQTLVVALARTSPPRDVQCYILDFGTRVLRALVDLPHVGAVVIPEEMERVERLLRFLLDEVERRKRLLETTPGLGTLAAYREQHPDAPPALLLLIDNFTEFASTYQDAAYQGPNHVETIARLVREGGNLDLHLVFTANGTPGFPSRILSGVTTVLTLELSEPGEYTSTVGRRADEPLPQRGVRGRGLVREERLLEFQAALPVAGDTPAARARALQDFVARVATAWPGERAAPIRTLPEALPLDDLLPAPAKLPAPWRARLAVPLGLDAETLAPLALGPADVPQFLIAGPPRCGKTTLLQTWAIALAASYPPSRVQLAIVAFGGAQLLPLRALPHTLAYAGDDQRLGELIDRLTAALDERRRWLDDAERAGLVDDGGEAVLREHPALVLLLDDYEQFAAGATAAQRDAIEQLVRRGQRLGLAAIVAGASGALKSAYGDSLAKFLREAKVGILLGSADNADAEVFNLYLGNKGNRPLPPGRGYLLRRGQPQLVQVATCHARGERLGDQVARIVERNRPLDRR